MRRITWAVRALCLYGICGLVLGPVRAEAPATAASDVEAAAERLAGAIRFPTISHQDRTLLDRDAFLGLHTYISEHYPLVGATFEREVVNEYSLLYTWRGTDASVLPVFLTSHLDVVPVPDATAWTQPPFAGTIAEGYIWGRGALDDKVGVFAMLEAAERLVREGFVPRRTVYFAFGHDEEVGGLAGAAGITALLEDRGVRVWFTLDEGMAVISGALPGVASPLAMVGVAEKGSLTLRLTAHAAGGHSSVPPPNEPSAIGRLAAAIQRLEARPMAAHLTPPVSTMLEGVAPHASFPLNTVVANQWLFKPMLVQRLSQQASTNALIRTTTAVTMFQSGIKTNVLPTEATATVNFRIHPSDTLDGVEAHVRAVIADPEITIERVGAGRRPSAVTDVTSDSFAAIAKTLNEVMPDTVPVPGLLVGGTDSKHYSRLAAESYRFTPLRVSTADLPRFHGVDERVPVDNYGEIMTFYAALIQRTAGADSLSGSPGASAVQALRATEN